MSQRVPRFSERIAAVPPPVLQIEAVNDVLRFSIWNLFDALIDWNNPGESRRIADFFARVFFKVPVHVTYELAPRAWLFQAYERLEWYGVYDFLEFVIESIQHIVPGLSSQDILMHATRILEEENAGYRYINGRLEPISTPAEVEEVEHALATTERIGLGPVHTHLDAALQALAQRPQPDARNAIKEAISAVEAVSKLLTGVETGGLDEALTALATRANLRPALKKAFATLYGEASGPHGVRHAMLHDAGIDTVEARFFVVACSAFVNFVVAKAEAAGLVKSR